LEEATDLRSGAAKFSISAFSYYCAALPVSLSA
jgi:hypothetical protein